MNNELIYAAKYGIIKEVESLLDKGADVHFGDDWALINAVTQDHTETVELLLDRGGDIHARKDHIVSGNDTVLICAVRNRDVETVKLLLSRGAIFTDYIINMGYNHTPYKDPTVIDLIKYRDIKELLKGWQQRSIKSAKR
jgi:ankyrin repeat protein